jgi:outer membrane receptor protein involved in Fe transport
LRPSLFLGAASAALAFVTAQPAFAQQGPAETVAASQDDQQTRVTAEHIVVPGEIAYRNRSEATAPVLEYGLDYFQRFEPLSAGDALKRVPSVTFLSDVIESDGARMRGLDPGYTQVLINGEQVPGSNDDRSFFMDRIPAELIERVEIVRSQSANRSGDAMAGALNIVLRDGLSLDGGYVRAGAMLFNDGRVRESFAGVWGGDMGPGRLLLGANVQGRRNPKEKLSLRFDDSPENDPNFFTNEFNNREDQSDTRNGTDYSANATYTVPMDWGRLEVTGFAVHTDRTESEFSVEYGAITGNNQADIQTIVPQVEDILQDNYSLNGRVDINSFGGETTLKVGLAEFKDDIVSTEEESEYDPFPTLDDFGGEREATDRTDREVKLKASHERDLFDGVKLDFGVDFQNKKRETGIITYETGDPADPYELDGSSASNIEETRIDPYAMVSGGQGAIRWEAGVRYETTDLSVDFTNFDDAGVVDDTGSGDNDYGIVLPSAHLKWDVTEADRLSFSVARTVRRPNFNFLSPELLDEELGDNDFQGNPDLKPETAWGADVGYERRLGKQGVAGINVFYRQVEDRIELTSAGVGSGGAGTFLFTPDNIGDGAVYGVEFDLSTPLDFVGLADTGVFFNYSWLDSEIDDVFGSRKFNDQSDFVLNVGFIQDLPSLSAAFGATYREQGDAFGRVVGEEVTTSYGADLEVFVEKSFGDKFTLRLVGQNLLDGSKDEAFNKFDSIGDQNARDFDEYELESEKAGPVVQLIGRMSF